MIFLYCEWLHASLEPAWYQSIFGNFDIYIFLYGYSHVTVI